MTMQQSNPRDAFIEAQRKMWDALREYHSLGYKITHEKWMRQAIEAFQAERCLRIDGSGHCEPTDCQDDRALLLKEILG